MAESVVLADLLGGTNAAVHDDMNAGGSELTRQRALRKVLEAIAASKPSGVIAPLNVQRRHAGLSPIFSTRVTNLIFESSRSPIWAVTSQQPGVENIK